jgi:peptidoglycan/xylan/chitin deacetylase (PgdA/CDA1 family)
MSIRSQLGVARSRVYSSFYRRVLPLALDEPIVSFTFDDFPRTALTTGGAILEEFGSHGTFYAAPSLMGSSSELGDHFTADDLSTLLTSGHELGNHTYGHSSARSLSCDDFFADVEKGKDALEKLTEHPVNSFCYPFGDVTLSTKKALKNLVASARGNFGGFNGPEIDLNLLRGNRIYGDIDQAPRLTGLIEENVRRRNWLIFYTHDVRPQPSPYGCTPRLLESIVAYAARCGSRILTVAQALSELSRVLKHFQAVHVDALAKNDKCMKTIHLDNVDEVIRDPYL